MNELTRYDRMRTAIIEAHSIDDVKDIRDKAEALRQYAKQAGESLENQNMIAEIKLRAERRAGELLKEMPKAKGVVLDGRNENGDFRQSHDVTADAPTLADLGITRMQSSRWQAIASVPEEVFEAEILETKAKNMELTSAGMLRVAKDIKREAKREQQRRQAADLADCPDLPATIIHGNFVEVCTSIPDESVDLIFTDPPYDDASVPMYGDMAEIAARVLKPGGSLITYVGHHAMPNVLNLMTPHLRFWWTLAVHHNGAAARLPGKWVFVQWKPMLWFVKGGRRDNEYVADFVESHQPDKYLHDWQQDTSEAAYYIEHLTAPGDHVLDPFCGSGTTCIAALSLARQATGIEMDLERVQVARGRIYEYSRNS